MACEQDDLLLEDTPETIITADVILGKGKGTKRATSSARSRPALQMIVPTAGIDGNITQVLPSSLAHNVTSIDVTINETEGAIPAQSLITLEKISDNGTNARFKATGLNFEGDYTPNLALNAQLTFRNEAGEAINNDPFEAFPTAQSKNGIYLRNLKINCDLDGSCVFTVKVKGNNAAQVASLQGYIANEAGDAQEVVFERSQVNDEEMNHASLENPVFIEQGGAQNNIIGQLTAYDDNGNALDSQIELVTFPEINYGPQVGKLTLTRFGNSEFYLAQTSVKGSNRDLATEMAVTFKQDYSESIFYDMPVIASNDDRELYWRTFDGISFNINPEIGTTMFGLVLDTEENVLDIKKKEIEVQQAAIMPENTSTLSVMENGNLQYVVTFEEPQDTNLVFWTVFEDGTRTEKGRYRMRPLNGNPAQWIAKNIKPSATNGLKAGDETKATQCRFDRGIQAMVDGRLDGELVVPSGETPAQIDLNQLKLYQNQDSDYFSLEAQIDGNSANEVAAVAVFITPQDGGSDADPEDFILEFAENTFNGKLFSNHFVTFGDPDTVIGYSYNTELTFLNAEGDELDYLEVQIVGEDLPGKTATLCMANGETPSEFSLTIETNDSNAQDLDALRIEFLNNGELFTIAQSYDMIRTESSDHTVTFSTSGIEFTDLNLVEEGLMVLSSPYTDLPYSSTLSFNATALKQYPLGYYNEETGKWECEDDCLEPDDSGQMCGETDHF